MRCPPWRGWPGLKQATGSYDLPMQLLLAAVLPTVVLLAVAEIPAPPTTAQTGTKDPAPTAPRA